MIPKSCRLFGQGHATKQVIKSEMALRLIPFRFKRIGDRGHDCEHDPGSKPTPGPNPGRSRGTWDASCLGLRRQGDGTSGLPLVSSSRKKDREWVGDLGQTLYHPAGPPYLIGRRSRTTRVGAAPVDPIDDRLNLLI